jgi:Ras-related protein Rab-2A
MLTREPDPDYRFKVVLIGAAGSGKTTIVNQLLTGQFTPYTKTTVGVDYRPYRLDVRQNLIQLELWDTAGQETYRAVAKTYFRGAVGCVLVFDTTSQESFDELSFWLGQFRQLGDPNAFTLLAGNKIDLTGRRQVSSEAAEQFAADNLIEYLEASAVTSQNIKETFERLARGILEGVMAGRLDIAREKPRRKEIEWQAVTLDVTRPPERHSRPCEC